MNVANIIFYSICSVAMLGSISTYAQSELPNGRFAIAGYGDVKYESSSLSNTSAFSARFVPIFLFSLNEKMHVEAETEISLNEDGETEVELEYADIHYFLTDTTTITAGKFLLPFGQFSANWHPSWINRSVWTPGIYGSHGSNQAMTPLLPVLSDVGIAIQKTFSFSGDQKVFLDLFASNGARVESDEHEEEAGEGEGEGAHDEELPEVVFEAFNADNNKNKAIGGRLAYAALPSLEIGTSFYRATYDDEQSLDFRAQAFDLNWIGSHYMLRGEYIQTQTDGLEEGEMEIHRFDRNGWFLQSTLQMGQIWTDWAGTELVLEYAETNELEEASRWMYGINYWLDARSVVKFGFEDTQLANGDDDQRIAIQFSYGF